VTYTIKIERQQGGQWFPVPGANKSNTKALKKGKFTLTINSTAKCVTGTYRATAKIEFAMAGKARTPIKHTASTKAVKVTC
jgi:hypothetical protein